MSERDDAERSYAESLTPGAARDAARAHEQVLICERCGQRLPFDISIEHHCTGAGAIPEARRWTILVCPVCDASRLGPLPAWGSWCDGACSHPVTEMEPVRVIGAARPLDIRGAEGATTEDFRGAPIVGCRAEADRLRTALLSIAAFSKHPHPAPCGTDSCVLCLIESACAEALGDSA